MRKRMSLILIVLLFSFNTGCVKEKEDWGIKLSTENVSSTGLTLLITQKGGNKAGKLQTGTYYFLEENKDNKWNSLELLPSEYPLAWDLLAWAIPENETVKWEENWESIYGKLPTGKYRMGKEVLELNDSNDIVKKLFYAEFEIK